jgi:hypothetical protein
MPASALGEVQDVPSSKPNDVNSPADGLLKKKDDEMVDASWEMRSVATDPTADDFP